MLGSRKPTRSPPAKRGPSGSSHGFTHSQRAKLDHTGAKKSAGVKIGISARTTTLTSGRNFVSPHIATLLWGCTGLYTRFLQLGQAYSAFTPTLLTFLAHSRPSCQFWLALTYLGNQPVDYGCTPADFASWLDFEFWDWAHGMNIPGREALSTVSQRIDDLVFSETQQDRAKAVLVELLDATVVVRGTQRTESGSPVYEERPDNPIRLAAAVKVLEWGKGKPKQVLDVQTRNPGTQAVNTQDLLFLMAKNTDIAAKVVEMIADAARMKQAVPIQEVKPTSPSQPPELQSGGSPSK